MSLDAWLASLQKSSIATAISESVLATASLSSLHALAFTLVMGGAIVSNLRLLGWLFPHHRVIDITLPAAKGIATGLTISIATGLLLFAPRALAAAHNGFFQVKMLLLASAALFHFTLHHRVSRQTGESWSTRVIGGVGLSLWLALALTACAYILLE